MRARPAAAAYAMPRLIRALHVAEKPSVAKKVAEHLSKGVACNNRQGPSVYNRLFDFETGGPPSHGACRVRHVVTSVTGHLMSTEFEEPHNKWHACAPRDLLCEDVSRVEWTVAEEKAPLKRQLEDEARAADWLVLWLDCDREGEAIAFEVVDVCKRIKPNVDLWRAKFSSVDEKEILKAWRSLGRPDKRKADAVAARCELDLRSGAAFTRFQTFRVQGKYAGVAEEGVVSYGPCQFPTLGFIVARQQEIDAHDARDFWRVDVETGGSAGAPRVRWDWRRKRVFDVGAAHVFFDCCVAGKDRGVLEKVEAKPAAKPRPLPLSTLELQKRASKWLKLGSAETMEVAEALYQRGYVSYPRTETELFRDTCDVRELVDRQRPDGRFGTFAAQLLDLPPDDRRAFLWPRQGAKDDEAHPPIHPTKAVAANELQGREAKVFELIARHFLACCARDARGRQTNATARLGGERFDARGLMVDERNFLDVYPYESWSTATLPPFFAGDALPRPSALNLARSRTQPPRGLTEADLLSKMDAHGIGTDATMADHIKTVLTRDYALRDNAPPHVFRPTPLGSALVEAYDAMGMRLNLPQLRAALEADVALVASGAKSKDAVLADCLRTMRDSFDAVSRDVAKLDDAMRRRFGGGGGGAAAAPAASRVANFAGVACGDCGATMALYERGARPTPTLRCDGCDAWWPLAHNRDYAPRGRACDACGFGTVDERHPESGRVFPRCPKCYERHPAPAAPVAACPRCAKPLLLSTTQSGRKLVSCTKDCGAAVWLPSCVRKAEVLARDCARCSAARGAPVKLLRLELPRGRAPPGTDLEPTVCALCDTSLLDLGLDRRNLQPPPQGKGGGRGRGQPPQQQRGGRGPGRGANHNRGRGQAGPPKRARVG